MWRQAAREYPVGESPIVAVEAEDEARELREAVRDGFLPCGESYTMIRCPGCGAWLMKIRDGMQGEKLFSTETGKVKYLSKAVPGLLRCRECGGVYK